MEYLKVNIPKPVYARLQTLQHKGQTIAGVIEELLDKVETMDCQVDFATQEEIRRMNMKPE
jgi:glutamine phosphoribosylpyrophosphate amidotransferase